MAFSLIKDDDDDDKKKSILPKIATTVVKTQKYSEPIGPIPASNKTTTKAATKQKYNEPIGPEPAKKTTTTKKTTQKYSEPIGPMPAPKVQITKPSATKTSIPSVITPKILQTATNNVLTNLKPITSNKTMQQMADNSTMWGQLENQKLLPNADVAELTNKQKQLAEANQMLGKQLQNLEFKDGKWYYKSGMQAFDVGEVDSDIYIPATPLEMMQQQTKAYLDTQPSKTNEDNALDWLKHNTMGGIAGISNAFYSTADLLLPDFLTPKPLQDYIDDTKELTKTVQGNIGEYNNDFGGTASEIGGAVYQSGVQMIPQALLAALSGGTSTAAQLGSSANAVQTALKSPAFWASFAQTAGPNYENAKENGAGELGATLTGMASGLGGAAIERMGGIESLGNSLGLPGIFRTAAEEAGEEVLQDVFESSLHKAIYDRDRAIYSTEDANAIINPQKLALNAGAGALLGGAFGGGNAILNSMLNGPDTQVNPVINAKKEIENPESAVQDVKIDGQSVQDMPELTLPMGDVQQSPGILKQGVWQPDEVKPRLKPEYDERPETALPQTEEEIDLLQNQLEAYLERKQIEADAIGMTIEELERFENANTNNLNVVEQNSVNSADSSLFADIAPNVVQQAQDIQNIVPDNMQPKQVDTEQTLIDTWKNVRDIQSEIKRIENSKKLTQKDKAYIDAALRTGSTTNLYEADNPQDVAYLVNLKFTEKGILQPVIEYNQQKMNDDYLIAAQDAYTISTYAKDKKIGFQYATETPERNIYDIFGKNRDKAEDFINRYITPVHKAVADGNKLKNEMRNRVKSLNLDKNESAIVQYWLEERYGEASKYIYDNKIIMTSDKEAKLNNAVTEFHDIYNSLFDMINRAQVRNGIEPTMYRKNYAPHFMEEKLSDNVIAKALYKIGIKIPKKNEIPTDLAGITEQFRPGKQWFNHLLRRKGDQTVFDAVKGFDNYIDTAADIITLTDSITKFRTLEDAIRYNYASDESRTQIKAIRDNKMLDGLAKRNAIEDVYDNILNPGALNRNEWWLEEQNGGMKNFVTELRRYTDSLAGKKSRGDRSIEDDIGRDIYEISKKVEGRVAANMIGLNPGSWLTNVIPLTQAVGETNPINLLKGMKDTIKAYAKDDGFVDASTFLTNRRGSDTLVKTNIRKVSDALGKPMEFIDLFVADSIVRGKTAQNMKNGMRFEDAIDEADSYAASLMSDRSKGSMPGIFERSNPINKIFTMFQLEVNNQLRYIGKDIPRRLGKHGAFAVATSLASMFTGAFIYNELYEKLTGRRAALDPVGMIRDAFFIEDDKRSIPEKVVGLGTDAAQQLPFVSGLIDGGRVPVSSALPDVPKLWDALTRAPIDTLESELDSSIDTQKRLYDIADALSGPAAYLLLPFGGGAIKRGIEGYNLISNDGSYKLNDEGEQELKFPAPGDGPIDYLKAMLFGQYSSEQAQNYINSGFRTFSADRTNAYKQLIDKYGIEQNAAFKAINDTMNATNSIGKTNKEIKRQALMNTDLPLEAKEYIDGALLDGDGTVDFSDAGRFQITNNVTDDDLQLAALDLYADGMDANRAVELTRLCTIHSEDAGYGTKAEQIANIVSTLETDKELDSLTRNNILQSMVVPKMGEKFTSPTSHDLIDGIDTGVLLNAYYAKDTISEEVEADTSIHALDKDDYKNVKWKEYVDNLGLGFTDSEKLQYFISGSLSKMERTWDDYKLEGNSDERALVDYFKESGISVIDYQVIKSGMDRIYADKDANGKSISGTKKLKVMAYLDKWSLTPYQYNLMMMADGYSID